MSRYIGKRVSYTCGNCSTLFSLSRKSVDDSQFSGECFCSNKCFVEYSRKLDENRKAILKATEED